MGTTQAGLGFWSGLFKGKPSIKRRVDSIPIEVQDAKPMMCAVRVRDLFAKKIKKGGLPSADLRMIVAYQRTLISYDHPAPQNLKEAKQLVKYLEIK